MKTLPVFQASCHLERRAKDATAAMWPVAMPWESRGRRGRRRSRSANPRPGQDGAAGHGGFKIRISSGCFCWDMCIIYYNLIIILLYID